MTALTPDSQGQKTSRGRMTWIKVLVVMGVIAILISLTAAAIMEWISGPVRNSTETELRAIDAILKQHWNAVVADARMEQLWSADRSNLLSLVDNDKERARIMLIKIRLMEAFPVNFDEIPPAGDLYVAAPYNLIPTGKRRYRKHYQELIYDPDTLKPRWKTADLTGKESVESAVCLFLACDKATRGINPAGDMLKPFMVDTDDTGTYVLADGWRRPLRFYRFGTGNADLQKVAPPSKIPGAFDPLDPNGKLLNWPGVNAVNFDNTIHVRTTTDPVGAVVAQFAIPVIVSAGPDGKFGLPAVDQKTKTRINASGIPTIAGAAPYQSMQVPAADASSALYEKDNIYSFKKAS